MSISNDQYMARIATTLDEPITWHTAAPDWCDTCTSAPCQCVTPPPVKRGRIGALTNPADVKYEKPEWIKRDWYPTKVVTMISGRGGSGKSSLTLADIAAGSRGELRGRCNGRPMRSIIVSVEDSQGMQKARLKAAGADERYYRFFTVTDAESDADVIPAIPGDLPELERLAKEFDADLIVVDPLSSVIHGNLDKAPVVRAALDPLALIARNLNLAVVTIHHHKKGGGAGNDLASGTHAFRDIVRSSLLVAHDPDSDQRVITFDKSNYSTLQGTSLAFDLVSVDMVDDEGVIVLDDEGNTETVAVARVTGETDLSVEQIVNRDPGGDGSDADERNACQTFLLDYLTRNGLEVEAGKAMKAGAAAGFSQDQMKKARSRSRDPKIKSRPATGGPGWVWAIDGEGATTGASVSVSGTYGTLAPSQVTEVSNVAPAFSSTGEYVSYPPVTKEGAIGATGAIGAKVPSTESGGTSPLLCIMCDTPALPDTAACSEHVGLASA